MTALQSGLLGRKHRRMRRDPLAKLFPLSTASDGLNLVRNTNKCYIRSGDALRNARRIGEGG